MNPDYAWGQLHRAMETAARHENAAARARAEARITRWREVIADMAHGTLRVGSRAPIAGVPAWATLEVAHGGFPTGALRAEGPLLPHEVELAARFQVPCTREALNHAMLTDAGLAWLRARVERGCYRVDVPEEGALLAVAWLIDHAQESAAMRVLDAIEAWFPRLRFYPVPTERPATTRAVVHLRTVGQVLDDLGAVRARVQIERLHEALRHWTPLYDEAVSLFLETVEGEVPSLQRDAAGALVRRPDGNPVVQGGWPCRAYPNDWSARAQALLTRYASLRATHRRSGKPEHERENFCVLRKHLAVAARDPRALTGRDVGMIRKVLASFATAHGAPGSARRAATRAAQARDIALPTMSAQAQVLRGRLDAFPRDAGVDDLGRVTSPLDADEAATLGCAAGDALPASLLEKVERCWAAPVDALVARGVVTSADVLAALLPQLTAQVAGGEVDDPAARRIFSAVYAAFRRRRSLLLLHLASQVKLEELPCIAALQGPLRAKGNAAGAARQALREVSALALGSFPEAIVPNKLLTEMVALATAAGVALPLTEELAADIFMGAFGVKFLTAAKLAAQRLRGTLYARYYDLPCEALLALDDATDRWGTKVSPGFFALCQARASAAGDGAVRPYRTPAQNGMILEQAQVLTTHNLAALYEGLALRELLDGREGALAQACFEFVCRRLQVFAQDHHARLLGLKASAYAWRQMLFFASVASPEDQARFLPGVEAHFAAQDEVFRAVFAPAMEGLRAIARGGHFDAAGVDAQRGMGRRFLGWGAGRHWLT
ncbi:MAG: hypothetical protein U0325_07785 [Polyangiales bacterium]